MFRRGRWGGVGAHAPVARQATSAAAASQQLTMAQEKGEPKNRSLSASPDSNFLVAAIYIMSGGTEITGREVFGRP